MAMPLKHAATGGAGRLARSSYREFALTDRRLSDVVACAWAGEGGWTRTLRLLPDGCVDLVWDGESLRAFVASAVARWAFLDGSARNVGLRLRCGAAGAILGTPLAGWQGVSIRVVDLWGSLAADAEARLAVLRDPAAQAEALEALVSRRLDGGAWPDRVVIAAAQRLAAPTATVGATAAASEAGERALRQRFAEQVGLSPKATHRVLRFAALVRRLPELAAGAIAPAGVAVELGYADQAHMGRECVRIAGSSPGALLRAWRAA